ncbi:MAG TPA: TonB-dependent receptor [Steroidobacteraceae bacterium]|nr:TonB-dependent receptor [Steroidobacteraceae bacterium]
MPAFAQEQESESVDTVIVTGSRIAQPNLTTTSPVTQVTAQDVATQGVTRIEDLVNQLPQAFAAQNATVANGSTGTATVDLRGLGSARTLVLVDGRRMPYGGVTNSAADLNQIPTIMVERVEILTGGASAVYGSDAVSGVVNFIMKKNFTGVQIDGQYNFYQHNNSYGGPGPDGLKLVDQIKFRAQSNPSQFVLPDDNVTDGYGREGSIMLGVGTEDGRGNITAYATIRKDDEVLQANRDFSACTLSTTAPTLGAWGNADLDPATLNRTPGQGCGGSGTAYPGTFTDFSTYSFTVDSATGNTFRPFSNALDQYNFGPVNHYLRPDKYYSFGSLGHYELSDNADVYMELMFTDYRSIAQIAPGGAFFDSSTINCDNPLLSAQQATAVGCSAAAIANTDIAASTSVPMYLGRRNVEGGGRQQDFHNSSFRGVAGVRGAISQDWSYDVSGQFARVSADQITNNYFQISKLKNAMDVVGFDALGAPLAAPACRAAVTGADPNCVPYNPFTIGGVTQDQLNYLQSPGLQTGVIDQEVLNASVTGDLGSIGGQLPTAAEPIKLAFGVEYRRDKLTNKTDDLLTTAGLSGTGGPTIGLAGSTNVTDLFMEGRVPLVQDKPGAHDIAIDVAYRYSDYGSDLTTDTYKIGGDWAPTADIRFRASYQRAVRAANVIELFTAQGFNLFDMVDDPCGAAGRPDIPVTATQCATATAVGATQGAPALSSPAGQYNFLQGGNPALTPEKSDTTSFGVIFTPRFAPGLSVTLDYFDIKIEDSISTVGADNVLKACYIANDPNFCAHIHRNAGNGSLWIGDGHVDDLNVNIGSLSTTGVDVNVNYAGLDFGRAGKFNFNLTGTWLDSKETDPLPGILPSYDCAGFYTSSCGVPNPTWRHHARIGWTSAGKGLDLAFTWRYYSSVDLFGGNPVRIDYTLPSQSYFDLAGSFTVMEKVDVRLGVNNILDRDPPLTATVGTTGNGNTFPQTYDALGRYIFGGVSVKF